MSAYTWSPTSVQFAAFVVSDVAIVRFIGNMLDFAISDINSTELFNVSGQNLNESVNKFLATDKTVFTINLRALKLIEDDVYNYSNLSKTVDQLLIYFTASTE